MADLSELGFERRRTVDPRIAVHFREQTGSSLPAAYLDFLCFRPPRAMMAFDFKRADGQDAEGCVSEFHHLDPRPAGATELVADIVRPAGLPGRTFLPFGTDPGGNWLCLELTGDRGTVVDVDSSTGDVSVVASDFMSFVAALRRLDQ